MWSKISKAKPFTLIHMVKILSIGLTPSNLCTTFSIAN
jgi:hypothetical protein